MDLADPRLKGKVTIPPAGDIGAGGFLLALAAELGKDYKDPDQMKEVVDWVKTNLIDSGNVVKVTNTQSELQSLLESGQADAEVYWNASTRLEYFGGHTNIAQVVPQQLYPINGYLGSPRARPTRCWPRRSSTGGCAPRSSSPTAGTSATGHGPS